MNKNILKKVILEQIEIIQNAEIIERAYKFEQNVNYILVGLRRAGKSTLLYKIARDLDYCFFDAKRLKQIKENQY